MAVVLRDEGCTEEEIERILSEFMPSPKTPKAPHGGRRKGAGRKSTGRVQVGYRVAPQTAAWLKSHRNPGRILDGLVRREVTRIEAEQDSQRMLVTTKKKPQKTSEKH
jgi:hypothetical protein